VRGHGYGALALGAVSAGVIILGKFVIVSAATTCAGVALLLAASVLSLFRERRGCSAACLDSGAPVARIEASSQSA